MRAESRCHDQALTPRSVFIVTRNPLPENTPLRLVVPGVPAAFDALLTWVRASVPEAREVPLNATSDGPDAEAALLDYWTDMPEGDRRHVWGVVGPLAGALVRFGDRPAVGFALLSSTHHSSEPPNAQARSLLVASVADSWSLALDAEPPVDASSWRARLWSIVESWWRAGLLEDPDAGASAFCDGLLLGDRTLPRTDSGQALITLGHVGVHSATPAGWLDRELFARRDALARSRPDTGALTVRDTDAKRKSGLESKVLRGRRGRLFLARDSHDSHRQIVGDRPLSATELDAWARGTEARIADLSALGCRYLQLVGPAPQVVHADDLPDNVSVAADRPVTQVLERLRSLQPKPEVLYPLEALRRVCSFREPFSKTDSHWNDLGAYLAYEAILDGLRGDLPVRRLERGDVSFHDTCYVGDLGGKLRPERASTFLRARINASHARVVEDNRVRNHGRRAAFECHAAPPTTCIVFGDSWAYSLMLFLAESFRRVVFFHRVNVVDRAPIVAERPDLVLSVLTERFCTALPLDHDAIDFKAVVARRLRDNDIVPEPLPGERHPFLFSLALDRGLSGSGGVHLPD